jgi:hypothetical protein
MIGGLNALASAKMVIVAMAKPKRFIQTAESHRGLEEFYVFENHWTPPFLR